ncbi:MAG: hypothetical protein CMP10_03670 [Zetaproteobacteria bacterium]|nr:hypothetical protein [Pseudobdellovibrionaceae bacterium]
MKNSANIFRGIFVLCALLCAIIFLYQSQNKTSSSTESDPVGYQLLEYPIGRSALYKFSMKEKASFSAQAELKTELLGTYRETVLSAEDGVATSLVKVDLEKVIWPQNFKNELKNRLQVDLAKPFLVKRTKDGSMAEVRFDKNISAEGYKMIRHFIMTFSASVPAGTAKKEWKTAEPATLGTAVYHYTNRWDENIAHINRKLVYFLKGNTRRLSQTNKDIKVYDNSIASLTLSNGLWQNFKGKAKVEVQAQQLKMLNELSYQMELVRIENNQVASESIDKIMKQTTNIEPKNQSMLVENKLGEDDFNLVKKELGESNLDQDLQKKTRLYGRLIDILKQNPDFIDNIYEVVIGLDPAAPGFRDQVAIYLGTLGQLSDPASESVLKDLLSESLDRSIQFQALAAIGDLPDPTQLSSIGLIQFHDRVNDVELKNIAMLSLGSISHKSRIKNLEVRNQVTAKVLALAKADPDNSHKLLGVMGNTGSDEFLPYIESGLQSADSTMRLKAIYQLRRMTSRAGLDALSQAIQSEKSQEVRMEGLKAFYTHEPGPATFAAAQDIVAHSPTDAFKLKSLELLYDMGSCCIQDLEATLLDISVKQQGQAVGIKASHLLEKLGGASQ